MGLCKNMEVSDEFRTSNPENWKNEKLDEAILSLSREHIPNDMVRHRAIIQALTIINIKNQRHFDYIEKRNLILTWVIVGLTGVSITLSILQFILN